LKIYDSLVTQMEEGRIMEMLDWNSATYDQSTVLVPLHNDDSDEYYEIILSMTACHNINPDGITKADISLMVSTISGSMQFLVDVGTACHEFGCVDMTDEELSMLGIRMTKFINSQAREPGTGKMANIIHFPVLMEREDRT
jgi:hypothetical protein